MAHHKENRVNAYILGDTRFFLLKFEPVKEWSKKVKNSIILCQEFVKLIISSQAIDSKTNLYKIYRQAFF